MTTTRRFCRFTPGDDPVSLHEIPPDGFCLSTFLLLHPENDSRQVLVGRLDPRAHWDHLGGLSSQRVEAHRNGWLLPASQLLFGESPEESALRIRDEQLPGLTVQWEPPRVDSEVYTPRRWPEATHHWDLRFVFTGTASDPGGGTEGPWLELRWLDLESARPEEFARSHEDILLRQGYRFGAESGR